MPHFTLQISPHGPIVRAAIMLSAPRMQMLTDAGQAVPDLQSIDALIDTGASISGVETSPVQPGAVLPTADLKPLYDFALDCQACQAKLTAAQADLADEKNKSAALTKQRDDALQAAKGGSVLRRVARAAKWFLIGAAAGVVAAKAATR